MDASERLVSRRFPRASKYHPDWVIANASGGANALQLADWLSQAVEIRPEMRVLDLGCGKASTSIFLAREFGCQVYACDLWFSASDNQKRIIDADLEGKVIPLHIDARMLPFAAEFFDLIVCIDAYYYFGADPLYLNYLANFVKVGGRIAIAGAGLTRDIDTLPEHLREWWTQDLWALQSADWLRRHWAKTGIVEVEAAGTMEDGHKAWLDWHRVIAPDNAVEIAAIEADAGKTLGYVRAVGRRLPNVKLEEYCWPDPLRVMMANSYEKKPMMREES
jgi:cyclopropane fatty-acyl-phospholipid synthase-like methyltransferase